jgi:hypothetical protein
MLLSLFQIFPIPLPSRLLHGPRTLHTAVATSKHGPLAPLTSFKLLGGPPQTRLIKGRQCGTILSAPAPPRAPPPHPPRAAAPIRGTSIAASAPRYPCGGHFPGHLFRISLLHVTWEGPVHKHSACVVVNPCATSAGTGRLCCIHLQLSPPILKPALHARTSRSLQLVACALPPLRSISRAPPPSRSGDAAQTSSALRLPTAAVF